MIWALSSVVSVITENKDTTAVSGRQELDPAASRRHVRERVNESTFRRASAQLRGASADEGLDIYEHSSMAVPAADQLWKDRYRELVRDVETKEREWSSLEVALRSAAGKLALAAMGQDSTVNAALEEVVDTLRRDLSAPRLDASVSALVRALQVQDVAVSHTGESKIEAAPTVAPQVEASSKAEDEVLRQLLAEFLASLARIPALAEVIRGLQARLKSRISAQETARLLDAVADAVAVVTGVLQSQRADLEQFLVQVTGQLAMLERWTRWQQGAAQRRRDDNVGLERTVEAEMTGLRRDVEDVKDPAGIKDRVQARLDAVAEGLRVFRESEERRNAENEQHAAELKHEVTRLQSRTDELSELCAAQETRLMVDSLTGVHSRYAYESRLTEEHQRWLRHAQPLAYTIWDIDRFKRINDRYGHEAGDRLLRGVAEILNRQKRAEDFLARIGGEEFVLLLPMTSQADAVNVANKLRVAIEAAAFHYKGHPEHVTISCGVTEFRPGDDPAAVYERADKALYTAKAEGRNRCIAL
jgi:diguanylate cyclase